MLIGSKYAPPVGIYEHMFHNPGAVEKKKSLQNRSSSVTEGKSSAKKVDAENIYATKDVEIDMKMIVRPYKQLADK